MSCGGAPTNWIGKVSAALTRFVIAFERTLKKMYNK